MANMSDVLLAKLSSISWLYSINCQIHGRDNTLLLKYIIEEDFYAVMVTDLTQTYFECLDGKGIDEHFHRFNKGDIKRDKLISLLKTILNDVTKANEWHFETLLVDCHTSRLTLKVKNQFTLYKFEWSFYMITTNPETLSNHLTIPLLRLVSSLRHGIDLLKKEIKTKNKRLEQIETKDNKTDTQTENDLSEESLINKMIAFRDNISNSAAGNEDNSLIINYLVNDNVINSVLNNVRNSDNSSISGDNSDQTSNTTNSQKNESVGQKDNNTDEDQIFKQQIGSQLSPEVKRQTTRTNKRLKL